MTLLIFRLLPISPSHHAPFLHSDAVEGSSYIPDLGERGIRRSVRERRGTYLHIDIVVVGRNSFGSDMV